MDFQPSISEDGWNHIPSVDKRPGPNMRAFILHECVGFRRIILANEISSLLEKNGSLLVCVLFLDDHMVKCLRVVDEKHPLLCCSRVSCTSYTYEKNTNTHKTMELWDGSITNKLVMRLPACTHKKLREVSCKKLNEIRRERWLLLPQLPAKNEPAGGPGILSRGWRVKSLRRIDQSNHEAPYTATPWRRIDRRAIRIQVTAGIEEGQGMNKPCSWWSRIL